MNRETARRLVAEAVLADVAADDVSDRRTVLDRLRQELADVAPEALVADDDVTAVLNEALDLAAYLGAWVQDFGASVQLVFGALPVGAGLPTAPSAEDIVREWQLGDEAAP